MIKMKITKTSAITGITRTRDIPVDPENYILWKSGYASIDEIMPYLTAADRDFITGGIVAEEWNLAFA